MGATQFFFPVAVEATPWGRPGIKGGPEPTILTFSSESNHEVLGEFSTAFVLMGLKISLYSILLSLILNHASFIHMF